MASSISGSTVTSFPQAVTHLYGECLWVQEGKFNALGPEWGSELHKAQLIASSVSAQYARHQPSSKMSGPRITLALDAPTKAAGQQPQVVTQ